MKVLVPPPEVTFAQRASASLDGLREAIDRIEANHVQTVKQCADALKSDWAAALKSASDSRDALLRTRRETFIETGDTETYKAHSDAAITQFAVAMAKHRDHCGDELVAYQTEVQQAIARLKNVAAALLRDIEKEVRSVQEPLLDAKVPAAV